MASSSMKGALFAALCLLLLAYRPAACSHARSLAAVAAPASCCTPKKSSAIAVSIVFAACQDDVVMAAESIAQASVSGCGDAYAAGLGVSVATLAPTGPGGLANVLAGAFSGCLTTSNSKGAAVAVAQGLAVALASAAPCEFMILRVLVGHLSARF